MLNLDNVPYRAFWVYVQGGYFALTLGTEKTVLAKC